MNACLIILLFVDIITTPCHIIKKFLYKTMQEINQIVIRIVSYCISYEIFLFIFLFQNSINIYNIKQALHSSATEIVEY